MRRRKLLAGLVTGLPGLLVGRAADAKSRQKQTIERLQRHQCGRDRGQAAPFSVESRGVGSIIIRARSRHGVVGVVVPIVPKSRRKADYTLDLGDVREEDQLDHLFVCVLHNHWDHGKNLQLFQSLAKDPSKSILIAGRDGKIDKPSWGGAYENRILPSVGQVTNTLLDGSIECSLTFVLQGEGGCGHANHIGTGKTCSATKPHCGARLLPSPDQTYCLIGEISNEDQTFTFFVNDAASAHTADAIPASLRAPNTRYDLAMVAIPDGHLAYGYPNDLVAALEPDELWWIHWEDFIFRPKYARKRVERGKAPRTAGQLALPLDLVDDALDLAKGSCFPGHGAVAHFGAPRG